MAGLDNQLKFSPDQLDLIAKALRIASSKLKEEMDFAMENEFPRLAQEMREKVIKMMALSELIDSQ